MTSKVTEEPDALSTARADLTDVSNLLYAAFMAADSCTMKTTVEE